MQGKGKEKRGVPSIISELPFSDLLMVAMWWCCNVGSGYNSESSFEGDSYLPH